MKKILVVLLFVIFANAFSQVAYKYYPVQSGTTNDLKDIRALYQFSSSNYFICGDNGTLLKIYNADSVCRSLPFITWQNLYGININFSTSGIINYFIYGSNGYVLRTTNSGGIWTECYTGFPYNLYSGTYLKPGSGNLYTYRYFSVGAGGVILKRKQYSNDTGWVRVSSGTANDLKSITTHNTINNYPYCAWICGNNGTILRTLDTGNTWVPMVSGTNVNLNHIYFKTIDTGFVVGDSGTILKTTNGGINWNMKFKATLNNLKCIAYLNDTNICATGNQVVLFSTDRGENWAVAGDAPKYNFNSVNFLYSGYYQKYIPFFAGDSGRIYKRNLDTTFHPNININLEGNNIKSGFSKKGTFNNGLIYSNSSGFEWPKGSGKTAIYTAGLCIGAYMNNQLKEAMASYSGEYSPGYCEHGIYRSGNIFKYYKVSRGDNAQNNWDWANWGLMVPYGAPFVDVNANGRYEPEIDTPGVKNAAQTIFYCMTDADPTSHNGGEGFGGGTRPLGSEVHLTAWAYDTPGLEDVQFINYIIINRSDSTWNKTHMALYCDPDLGDATDDYVGCDTSLKLMFCYNSDNEDYQYGANPPSVGMVLLTSPVNHSVIPERVLGMTASISPYKYIPCESEPNGQPYPAYLMLKGFKKDSTSFLDPTASPYSKTKFTFTGEPESNTGWTRPKGFINNCGHDTTGNVIAPAPPGDMKMYISSGAEDLNIAPGDTQRFVIAQLIARGTSNLNSVTELKNLCRSVRTFYEQNFPFVITPTPVYIYPTSFLLEQNYPNPFNAATRIKFHIPKINGTVSGTVRVVLKIYDLLGREVQTLINGEYSAQDYEVIFDGRNFASGMYFYKMTAGDYSSVKRMLMIK